MIKKIDHLGIAVADLNAAIERYTQLTGKGPTKTETVPEQKVETAFFPIDSINLELLKGTSKESPVSKFIAKRSEGIHHICFEVDDLDKSREALLQMGFVFIEMKSDAGAHGSRVAFIHPKSTGGILMELVEYPRETTE